MHSTADRGPDEAPICQTLGPAHEAALVRFFARLQAHGVDKFFHPHPLTAPEAANRAAYSGRDYYCVLLQGTEVAGYGMLRGWDEGYQVPSLGIVIDPSVQGRGHGRRLMEFLHAVARERRAPRIRLKVYPDNIRAVTLYRSLGYEFQPPEHGQLVGILPLAAPPSPPAGEPAR